MAGFASRLQLHRLWGKWEVEVFFWDASSISDMASDAPERADPAARLGP